MNRSDLLPGTLELLILRTLAYEPRHGYGIAQRIQAWSDGALEVGEGSLYPALQRLLERGDVRARWDRTETGRRARFYTLTRSGERRLGAEREAFDRQVTAIRRVLAAGSGAAP